jgi:hypothetical protein
MTRILAMLVAKCKADLADSVAYDEGKTTSKWLSSARRHGSWLVKPARMYWGEALAVCSTTPGLFGQMLEEYQSTAFSAAPR